MLPPDRGANGQVKEADQMPSSLSEVTSACSLSSGGFQRNRRASVGLNGVTVEMGTPGRGSFKLAAGRPLVFSCALFLGCLSHTRMPSTDSRRVIVFLGPEPLSPLVALACLFQQLPDRTAMHAVGRGGWQEHQSSWCRATKARPRGRSRPQPHFTSRPFARRAPAAGRSAGVCSSTEQEPSCFIARLQNCTQCEAQQGPCCSCRGCSAGWCGRQQ